MTALQTWLNKKNLIYSDADQKSFCGAHMKNKVQEQMSTTTVSNIFCNAEVNWHVLNVE